MRLKALSIVSACLFGALALADGPDWMHNFEEAKAKALAENKYLLLNFSGSDWCGWCKRLNAEVFNTEVFKEYASSNLVLAMFDFPRYSRLPEDMMLHNMRLKYMYQVSGYPSIFVQSPDAKKIIKTGYIHGGAENYIKHIEEIIAYDPAKPKAVKPPEGEHEEEPPQKERVWTAENGMTIAASFQGMDGGVVVLRKANGGVVRLSMSSFSEEDQAYLRSVGAVEGP